MKPIAESIWYGVEAKDMLGKEICAGDKLARCTAFGRKDFLQVFTVRQVKDGKVYLDTSKNALRFPGRCLRVNEIFDQ